MFNSNSPTKRLSLPLQEKLHKASKKTNFDGRKMEENGGECLLQPLNPKSPYFSRN